MLKIRSRKAFTLLELVVALVVLGILAALAVPTYLSVINNSKVATATSTAVSVATDAVALGSDAQSAATYGNLSTAVGETSGVSLTSATNSSDAVTTTGTDTLSSADLTVTNNGNSECIAVNFTGTVNGPPTANGTC
jgi:prepilin-type N-terminal cleavage/methylation domain-containing protein